jgi:hypothetical protein
LAGQQWCCKLQSMHVTLLCLVFYCYTTVYGAIYTPQALRIPKLSNPSPSGGGGTTGGHGLPYSSINTPTY